MFPATDGPSRVRLGAAVAATAACEVGETRAASTPAGYTLFPSDELFYTLLDVAGCTTCGVPARAVLDTAHVVLTPAFLCSTPVEVSVVGATISDNCAAPDPSVVLCPPVSYELTPDATGEVIDFRIPLSGTCCIDGIAFLLVRMTTFGCYYTGVPLAQPCTPCFSYHEKTSLGISDTCSGGLGGNPLIYVDASCCAATPARRTTWGGLKILYR